MHQYQTIVNQYRNVGVVVDVNPQYRRVLRCTGDCVDIVKMTPEEYREERWNDVPDPLGALKFANTFTRSFSTKTERALKMMEQIMKDHLGKMTLDQLNAEYRRLTNVDAQYTSKEAALRAIGKITGFGVRAGADAKAVASGKEEAAPAAARRGRVKNASLGRPRTKSSEVTKEQLERAKKIASAKRGVGALIVELLKKGKDNDAVASAAIKKFPDKKITPNRVAWYRSMLRTAKVKGV